MREKMEKTYLEASRIGSLKIGKVGAEIVLYRLHAVIFEVQKCVILPDSAAIWGQKIKNL